jgi:hypothetical protein
MPTLCRQGVVKRTHLVSKLVEQLPPSHGGIWLYIARNHGAIRRNAAFVDACVGGSLAIRCCHDGSSVILRSGGRLVIYACILYNSFLSSTMRHCAIEFLFGGEAPSHGSHDRSMPARPVGRHR